MCGILGVSTLNRNTRPIIPFLAWEMQRRGDDSWGASDGNEVIREMGAIRKSFYIPTNWVGNPVIVHTRRASQGKVNLKNAHPLHIKNIIGIHNGTLINHTELNRIHQRNYDVDTAHIFHHLADELPLGDIGGTAAIAWFDQNTPGFLYLCRISTPALVVAKLTTGELIFASEKTPIEEAVAMGNRNIAGFIKIEPNLVYKINCESNEIFETTKRYEFRAYQQLMAYSEGYYNGYQNHHNSRRSHHSRYTWTADKKKCISCEVHLDECSYICSKCVEDNLKNAHTIITHELLQKANTQ